MVNIRLLLAAAFLLTALSLGAFAETAPRSALSQGATIPSATASALYLPYVSAPDAFPTPTATSTMTPVASSTATATPTATRTPTALPPTASSSTPSVTPTTTVTPNANGCTPGTHEIVAGDLPGTVAAKYDVTVAQLDEANVNTKGYTNFIVGVKIVIPCP